MAAHPSPATGLRLALRLYKLVFAGWLITLAVFVPAQAVVGSASAAVRANLPATPLPPGEASLIFLEVLWPVATPLALSILCGWLALAAWSVLWHAGTVRWWLGAASVRVRLAEIIGHGVVWWWRYARFSLVAVIVPLGLLAGVWLPVLRLVRTVESKTAVILLPTALAMSAVAVLLCWPAALRGAWLLGESGRRSAVVAWLRGLGASFRHPFGSLLPLLVWALPGAGLSVAPLLVDGAAALPVLLAAPLLSFFCSVALHLSFATPEPPEAPYGTGRMSTQPPPDR